MYRGLKKLIYGDPSALMLLLYDILIYTQILNSNLSAYKGQSSSRVDPTSYPCISVSPRTRSFDVFIATLAFPQYPFKSLRTAFVIYVLSALAKVCTIVPAVPFTCDIYASLPRCFISSILLTAQKGLDITPGYVVKRIRKFAIWELIACELYPIRSTFNSVVPTTGRTASTERLHNSPYQIRQDGICDIELKYDGRRVRVMVMGLWV